MATMELLCENTRIFVSNVVNVFTTKAPALGVLVGLVGLVKIAMTLDSLLSVLIDTLIPRRARLQPYKAKKTGASEASWAIVTGSTAGIGEQFAHQIAANGFNVALVSRSQTKLEEVAKAIEAKHPQVKTAIFVLDAITATAADYAALKSFTEKLGNVSILVNNLGVSHNMPTPFAEVPEAELRNIININCFATLEITRAVLPTLEAYTSANRSARALILTMGSMAGLTPTPLLSVYTGSKMFLQGWSSAIAKELQPKRIDVELIVSYLVTSKMSKVRRASAMCPNPKDFVRTTLREIGLRGGARERANTLTPYWSHALLHWAIETFLGVWSGIVASVNYKMHLDIRKRALRKLAKNK